MSGLIQDLRFGLRALAQQKGFTIAAAVALALGIGANTVMFSVVKGTLVRPIPVSNMDRLVFLFSRQEQMGLPKATSSKLDYLDWKKAARSFENMGASLDMNVNLTGDGQPERLAAAQLSASCLPTLGVKPLLGRSFTPEEEEPGKSHVAILGYKLWLSRFGGARSVVGKSVTLDGVPHTIIGVLPYGFEYPERRQLWLPLNLTDTEESRGHRGVLVAGRLKPDATLEQAREELKVLAAGLARKYPNTNDGWTVYLRPLYDEYVEEARPLILALFGAVSFVLLISCANVANLLLARFNARRREVAIRAALGASRGRIIRQMLTESILLGLMGGAFGILPALWGIDLFLAYARADLPMPELIRLDAPVLMFTLGVSIFTGLLFGIMPALQSSRSNLQETLKQGERGPVRSSRFRNVLVVSEVALALMLLIAAGLLMETFQRIRAVRPGFNPHDVMTMQISLPAGKYKTDAQRADFVADLVKRVQSLPGVISAATTSVLPLSGDDSGRGIIVIGRPAPRPSQIPVGRYRVISPGYLSAMRIPLVRGRFAAESDTEKAEQVVVINERTAATLWPNEDPIGKLVRFGLDPKENPPVRVVGIVGDVLHQGLTGKREMEMYIPYRQYPRRDLALVIRTSGGPPEAITPAVRDQLRQIDPYLPLHTIRSMDDAVTEATSDQKLAMLLFGIFAFLAMVLAAVGIYSVMAYTVMQRTKEIGVRMAIGAKPADVVRLVVRQGLTMAGIGIVLGIGGSCVTTGLLGEMLYGVSPTDPVVFAKVVACLFAVAFLANYIPAHRAARLDPVTALRNE